MRNVFGILLFLAPFFSQSVLAYQPNQTPLADFKTDGCSGFPDGMGTRSWLICCELHDIEYWAGVGGVTGKEEADNNLHQCLSERDEAFLSWLMPFGVRVAEPANFTKLGNTSFRWGYGWNFILGKSELPKGYFSYVEKKLDTILLGLEQYRFQTGKPQLTPEELQRINSKIESLAGKLK